jgi:hypothetical protein
MFRCRPASILAAAAVLAVLAACSSPAPTFTASLVAPSSGQAGDPITVGTTGADASAVLQVCGDTLDTTYVAGAYAFGGTTYSGRLTAAVPVRLAGTECAVAARLGTVAIDAGTFEYTASPVAGQTVLAYANLSTTGGADLAFDDAVDALVASGALVTRVAMAAEFLTEIAGTDFDVVVWIEEDLYSLSVATVEAITEHVDAGGRSVFAYWPLFDAAETAVPEARAAFGVADATNVTPVADASIDATLEGSLALGLDVPTVTLFNDGIYFASYATRMDPVPTATSTCTFADVDGGSCAVLGNEGRTLILSLTFAPLIAGAGANAATQVLENALTAVVFP